MLKCGIWESAHVESIAPIINNCNRCGLKIPICVPLFGKSAPLGYGDAYRLYLFTYCMAYHCY